MFINRRSGLAAVTRLQPSLLRGELVSLLWAGWLMLTLALPALADVAPPDQAPGSSISPAGTTQVRMLAERVVIDIRASEPNDDSRNLADDRAAAQVSATFLMRNLGQTDETMAVRFPLEASNGFDRMAQVEEFAVKVNGQPTPTATTLGLLRPKAPEIQWAVFEVTFSAGQDVTLEVSYLTRPTGYLPAARFDYLLETGAGWRDTIGSVDIIARLPYPAGEENVLLGPNRTNAGASYQTTPGGQFVDNEVRWHWTDLEPTAQDNLFINILVPQTWERIMAARTAVEAKPDDVEALLALAQAYEAAVTNRFPTESNDPYAALSEQTLARAIVLRPDSAELHTQLARWKWDHLMVQALLPPNDPILPSILAELHQALTLDPAYEPALTLLDQIKSSVDGPILPPVPPLRAWTVGPDGAVFVLDAANVLFQLDPLDLLPLYHSDPLFPAQKDTASTYLVADQDHVFVGSQAARQTLRLDRGDFGGPVTLPYAGPMALDPGHRLILASLASDSPAAQLLAYDLADLSRPQQSIPVNCTPVDLAADPTARLLYMRRITSCGSSHHNESYYVYDLDSLTEISRVGSTEAFYGFLARPVVMADTGMVAGAHIPYGSSTKLFTFDRQGQTLTEKSLPYISDDVAIAASHDWLYLRLKRGLAVLRAGDLSLQSFLPFTATVPADLALSPDGAALYLFGPDHLAVHSTAELQALGVAAVAPFPPAWTQPGEGDDQPTQLRLYRSPGFEQDNVIFAQLLPAGNSIRAEIYRSDDGGESWRSFPMLTGQVTALSLSPDFATDRTLVTDFQRSADGGETWTSWTPRLAFVSERDGNRELYTMEELGRDVQRLTNHPAADENPAWSPAWTRLALQSNRTGNWEIFSLRAECPPPQAECDLHQLTDDPADDLLPAWSPDGRRIAFVSTRDGNPEIYVMDRDGQNQRRLTFNPGGDWRPAWLPDSQRLVFTSDRSGSNDIYLLTVPPAGDVPLTAEPPLTDIVTRPSDDRDPAIGGSSLLSTYFDLDFGPAGYLFFLSDREGGLKSYVTTPEGTATSAERFIEADEVEAHPSWFRQYTLLVAVGQDEKSDIYALTPFSSPEALTDSPGFDGQPAGGPVWWQPD